MGAPNATLGQVPLLGSRLVQWTLKDGVRPHQEYFDVSPEGAKSLTSQAGKPLELRMTVNGITRVIKQLWLMNIVPGDNPQIMRACVADRRWMLPYFSYLRRYNMRRNIGFQRVGDTNTPVLQPVVPTVWYWRWSLKDPDAAPPQGKWQPSDILEDIFKAVQKSEKEYSSSAPGFTVSKDIKSTDKKLSIENFVIDDSGDAALLQCLSRLPEAGLYVNDNGEYVVYSKINGAEAQAVKSLGPEIVGGGHIMEVDNMFQRPKEIEVRFTIEAEVRHDLVQVSGELTTPDVRLLQNVIPVPDFSVQSGGQTVVQHTYLELVKLLTAWGTPPGVGGSRLSDAVLEKAALPYLDLWASLLLTGLRTPDQDWAARVGALQAHWRKTFRINPQWMDRTLQIKASRVGLIDVVSGTSGPAQAYCDHSFIGTQRSFFKTLNEGTLEPFVNIAGYPTGGAVPGVSSPPGARSLSDDSKAAPAKVSVQDPEQGIIQIDFQSDPNHIYEACLPGKIVRADEAEFGPTQDLTKPRGTSAIGFDMVTSANQVPKLSHDWKLAVIMTHIPASPNDERQLYSVTVKPDDVKDILPGNIGPAKGPKWVVRVRPGHDSARALIRWVDSRAEDIEGLFGITDRKPNLDDLVLNAKPQAKIDSQQAASLVEMARAIGASLYARFVDRFEGQASGHLHSALTIDGWMESVTVQVGQRGEGTTHIKMADAPVQLDFRSLLDSGTRAILDRIPQPRK